MLPSNPQSPLHQVRICLQPNAHVKQTIRCIALKLTLQLLEQAIDSSSLTYDSVSTLSNDSDLEAKLTNSD